MTQVDKLPERQQRVLIESYFAEGKRASWIKRKHPELRRLVDTIVDERAAPAQPQGSGSMTRIKPSFMADKK